MVERGRTAHGRARPRAGALPSTPRSIEGTSPGAYRGPGRFRHAGAYEVEREWRRYEGTPQRELLRTVRERFLDRALARSPERVRWAVEAGPGPGRFTSRVGKGAEHLALLDLSVPMLRAAADRAAGPRSAGPIAMDLVEADASRSPVRDRSTDRVVAFGNLVGFAGARGGAVLEGLARSVAPGGALLLETQGPITAVPRVLDRADRLEVQRWLVGDPRRRLPELLEAGWVRPGSSNAPRDTRSGDARVGFRFVGREEVLRALRREGLVVEDAMIAAPLTGGRPGLLEDLRAAARLPFQSLIRWEEFAGRHPAFLEEGGHLLTYATRPRGSATPTPCPPGFAPRLH